METESVAIEDVQVGDIIREHNSHTYWLRVTEVAKASQVTLDLDDLSNTQTVYDFKGIIVEPSTREGVEAAFRYPGNEQVVRRH